MKTLLAAVMLALVVVSAVPSSARADANQLYIDGLSLYQDGKYSEAERMFMDALGQDPRHLSSLFMMGETLSKDIRKLREAEGWYKKALRIGEKDKVYSAKLRYSLGILYIEMGQYEESLKQFSELVTQSPNYYDLPKVYNHMGVASYRLDRHDEALEYFKHALKLDPTLREATFNMKTLQAQLALINTGRYYERMGDDKAASEQYQKAVDSYPNYVAAWYHLGLSALKRKDYAKAVRLLKRAYVINPDYMGGKEVPYQLAASYRGRKEAGDLDEALAIYRKNPQYKDSTLSAGMVLLDKGMLDEAETELNSAATNGEDRKTQAEACYQLGRLYQLRGDKQNASVYHNKAQELAPGEDRYKSPL